MPRLLPGQSDKIDNINRLVVMAQSEDRLVSEEGVKSLLTLFHPMILKVCKKWSGYFDDANHALISWDDIICDAQYWFYKYTKDKYIIDGRATYNKFIKDHIDQRVRYMYECELNYKKHHIFPDPDKNAVSDGDREDDTFDDVIYRYAKVQCTQGNMDDDLIESEDNDRKHAIVELILQKINDSRYFTQRDRTIFDDCIYGNKTHEQEGRNMNISRTRVSQIVCKIKTKLYDMVDSEFRNWGDW